MPPRADVRSPGRLALTVGLLAFAAAVFASSLGLGPTARRVPLLVAGPMVLLLLVQLLRDLRSREGAGERVEPEAAASQASSIGVGIGWVLTLPILITLIGLYAAVPVYTVAFMRSRGAEPWTAAITLGGALGVGVWLVMEKLLSTAVPTGILTAWLGG